MKDQLKHPVFRLISEAADALGVQAYVIGGFVRDIILQRPKTDIDVVAIGSGIELANAVAERIGNNTRVSVFKNFGTAMLRYGEYEIEFVGARKESYRLDSRKPIVEEGSLEDDQNRRDFTINALALSLNGDTFGDFIDPFNGMQDMEDMIIRTPLDPDITFSDDPLRMMRAIRFATQLNFVIEEQTFQAIARNAERIKIVSGERVIDELNKIVLATRPSIGFKLLEKCGLLAIVFPQFLALKGVDTRDGRAHKDNFYHTLEVTDNVAGKSDDLWLRWAALLHDIAKPLTRRYDKTVGWTFHSHESRGARMVPSIFRQLKLPLNEKMKYVQKLVELHLRPIVLAEDIVSDSAVRRLLFEAGDDVEDLMLLCEADITSKNQAKVRRFLRNFELVRIKLKEIEEKDRVRNFQPPVSGELIMETFGITPCREVGIIKNAIKEAVLDGIIENNYQQAFQFMLEQGGKLGLTKQK